MHCKLDQSRSAAAIDNLPEINLVQALVPSQRNTRALKMHSPQPGCFGHVMGEIQLVCQTVIEKSCPVRCWSWALDLAEGTSWAGDAGIQKSVCLWWRLMSLRELVLIWNVRPWKLASYWSMSLIDISLWWTSALELFCCCCCACSQGGGAVLGLWFCYSV